MYLEMLANDNDAINFEKCDAKFPNLSEAYMVSLCNWIQDLDHFH